MHYHVIKTEFENNATFSEMCTDMTDTMKENAVSMVSITVLGSAIGHHLDDER